MNCLDKPEGKRQHDDEDAAPNAKDECKRRPLLHGLLLARLFGRRDGPVLDIRRFWIAIRKNLGLQSAVVQQV
jgi:hypothetical protein